MATGAWFVGSVVNMPSQVMSVTANAVTENCTITAGSYYLDDSSSARSLVEATATALQTHSQISTATCIVSRDRLVRFTADVAFTLTWTDTEARDLLGAANFGSNSTTQASTNVSPILWVPDRPENPSSRLGRDGDIQYDTVVSMSGGSPANIVATQHDERVYNSFDLRFIRNAYWDTGTGNVGGEFRTFHAQILRQLIRFKVYRQTLFDSASTTDVGLLSSNQLGPYRMVPPPGGPIAFQHTREIQNVERLHRVKLDVVQCSEYS